MGTAGCHQLAHAGSVWGVKQAAGEHTSAWHAWAKQQPLATLRAAAQAVGMDADAAKVASRAQLQNYLAAAWDPGLSQSEIEKQAAAAKAADGTKTSSGGQPAAPTSAATASVTPAGGAAASRAAAVSKPPGPAPAAGCGAPSTPPPWRSSRPIRRSRSTSPT